MTTLTDAQAAFASKALKGENIVAVGYPGSGKTFMGCHVFRLLPQDIQDKTIVTAFNVHSRKSFERQLGKRHNITTLNGLAWRMVSRYFGLDYETWKVDAYRHTRFITMFAHQYWEEANGIYTPDQLQAMDDLDRVISMVMSTVIDYSDEEKVVRMSEKFGVEMSDMSFIMQGLPVVMEWIINGLPEHMAYRGNRYRIEDGYAHDDLPYLVAAWKDERGKHIIPAIQCKAIMADEQQDQSIANTKTILRCLTSDGSLDVRRMVGQYIGFGDQNQALYYFRFVHGDMFGRIVNGFNASVVEMNTSFRLPKSAIPDAQSFVPSIRCADNAIEGEIHRTDVNGMLDHFGPGVKGIMLTKAQCVKHAYYGIRHGFGCVVRGKNIAADQKELLTELEKDKGFKFDELPEALETWMDGQKEFLKRRYKRTAPDKIQAMTERALSLQYMWDGAYQEGVRDSKKFRQRIDKMFVREEDDADAYSNATEFMTGHAAKGLEFDNVILETADMTSVRAGGTPEEAKQHRNTQYVMQTRHMKKKVMVSEAEIVRNFQRW